MSSPTTAPTAPRERIVGHGHDTFERVRARVAAIGALNAGGLEVPMRVTMLPDDSVAVLEPGNDAPTLQTVLDARGSLTAGECVWLGMAVAQALSVMHRAGLAHGAVSSAAVRLPSSDVLLGAVVDGDADSTAPNDVAALGELLASCVTGPESERVRAWTEPMTHIDPGSRPTAAMVARALGSCAHPEPLRSTPRGVASSMRAAVSQPVRVRRLPDARWWRWRTVTRRWALRGGMAALMAGALAGAGWAATAMLTPDEHAATPHYAATVSRAQDPAWVAQQATQARFDAWRHSDAEQLVKWTAEGSAARAEAEATAQALASGRMVVDGLTATITGVTVQPRALSDADGAVVTVSYTLSEHTVTLDGVETQFDSYAQTVDLDLVRGIAGWRVAAATPREPQP